MITRKFSDLSKDVQKALTDKADKHNEKHGKDKRKKTSKAVLGKVYLRGIGAYNENPESVRPQVSSAQQWAYARVNSFLYALKNLKFRGGKHDLDLLPKEHPLSSKNKNASLDGLELRKVAYYNPSLEKAPIDTPWGWENGEKEKVLEKGWDFYKRAHLWHDESNKESLSSYRLPIARLVDGKLKVVFRGVASAMGALNGNKKQPTSGISSDEKDKIYKVLQKYYNSFGKEAPELKSGVCSSCGSDPCICTWDISLRAVGDKDPTNFPKSGDDKKVSLRNSKYKLFPIDFAEKIRTQYPSIWKKGGNIKGNAQYKILKKIQTQNNGAYKTIDQEAAIRLREAWMARHLKDFRIAGVIAQIKWLGIGSRGLQYMKDLVNDEINKIEKKSKQIDRKSCIKDSEDNFMMKDLKTIQMRRVGGKKEYTLQSSSKESVQLGLGKMEIRNSIDKDKSYFVVEGIASSTSIDSYGTEMSIEALSHMKEQMDKGIPILPRHNSATASGVAEWDEVVGRTIEAEIRAQPVKVAANSMERQHTLVLRSQLYADNELSKELIKRLSRGEPIGQSIGGWFDQVRVIENEEGVVERVIVDQVTLDHVAITRAPANPDSEKLVQLRSSFDVLRGLKMTDLSKIGINIPEERHIAEVMEEGEFVIVKYKKMPSDMEHSELNELDKHGMEKEKEEEEEEDMAQDHEYMDDKEYGAHEEDEEEDMSDMKDYGAHKDEEEHGAHKEDEEYGYHKDEEEEESEEEEDMNKLSSFERMAIPYSEMPIAPLGTLWKFGVLEQEQILGQSNDWAKYKKAHLYMVDDAGENKQDYKLPIARMLDGELKIVFKGLVSAMAALNGARGGVKIPEADRKSVYSNIKKYYKLFDQEAPELNSEEEYDLILQGAPDKVGRDKSDESSNKESSVVVKKSSSLNSDQKLDKSIDKGDKTIQNKSDTLLDGDKMTENDLKNLAALIQSSLKPLQDRMDKLESASVEATKEEVDSKYQELEAKLERANQKLERVIKQPIQRGYKFASKSVTPEGKFSEMIHYSKLDGATTIADAVERNQEKLESNKTTAPQLEEMLKVTLRAAVADGIIGG